MTSGTSGSEAPLTREWRPDWPCPVGQVLSTHRRGSGDPTFRRAPDGSIWRGIRTPEGATSLRIATRPNEGVVDATAWGPGAAWVLDQLPRMLGADDDPTGFVWVACYSGVIHVFRDV